MTFVLVAAAVVGLYAAWGIGANDVANSMATSVGSKSLSLRKAVIIAAICEFAGAVLVGTHVASTVQKGIIDPASFASEPNTLLLGMLAALLATGIFLSAATFFGAPVSTTHTIVGSIFGFGLLVGGFASVNWAKMSAVLLSWVVSPLLGGAFAFGIFRLLRWQIFSKREPMRGMARTTPFLVFFVFFILTLSIVYKGLKNLHLDLSVIHAVGLSALVGLTAMLIAFVYERRQRVANGLPARLDRVEKVFAYLQVITAAYVAFAHGANDVANAVGPLAAIISIATEGSVSANVGVPTWALLLGGAGIVIGLATYGFKVIETVGRRMTELTPSRGFSAEIATATVVLTASKLGLPVSTTHTLVGAVIGVGLARGIAALNLRVIWTIFTSWALTIPIAAILTVLLFWLFRLVIPL